MFAHVNRRLVVLFLVTISLTLSASRALPKSEVPNAKARAISTTPSPLPGQRNIVYIQTFSVSLLPLIGSGITHIILASLHINRPGVLVLNDDPPDSYKFNQLWSDVVALQNSGITVMAMLGGAGVGSYTRLQAATNVSIFLKTNDDLQ